MTRADDTNEGKHLGTERSVAVYFNSDEQANEAIRWKESGGDRRTKVLVYALIKIEEHANLAAADGVNCRVALCNVLDVARAALRIATNKSE